MIRQTKRSDGGIRKGREEEEGGENGIDSFLERLRSKENDTTRRERRKGER